MAILTFPTLVGLTYPVKKNPTFYNLIQHRSVAGLMTNQSPQPYAVYQFDQPFSFLRSDAVNLELQKLMSFWQATKAGTDPFHFTDPDDNTITAQAMGTGDGTTTDFPFVRTMQNVTDPVQDANSAGLVIKVSGVTKALGTDYSILSTSQYGTNYGVRFAGGHVPTAGQAVTGTFTWNWLCKFLGNSVEFSKFVQTIWEAQSIKMETVLQ